MTEATTPAASKFLGPLFIVGMPRSGTKLLRSLLNQHPQIAICTRETDFLPYWVKHWNDYGDLSDRSNFEKFFRKASRLNYLKVARDHETLIGCDEWYRSCQSYDVADVFQALVKHELGVLSESQVIWGDKTPSYITSTNLLKRVYPSSKFIHIVRDVRDFCMSINKAWNKNVYRAAQRWSDDVLTARRNGLRHGDYLEIKYESLLENPERELRRACSFLGVGYSAGMDRLSRPVEKIGDATGAFIDKNNKSKYRESMSPDTLTRIEDIARTALKEFDYPVNQSGPTKRISGARLFCYEVLDGIALIRRRKVQTLTDVIVSANRQSS